MREHELSLLGRWPVGAAALAPRSWQQRLLGIDQRSICEPWRPPSRGGVLFLLHELAELLQLVAFVHESLHLLDSGRRPVVRGRADAEIAHALELRLKVVEELALGRNHEGALARPDIVELVACCRVHLMQAVMFK